MKLRKTRALLTAGCALALTVPGCSRQPSSGSASAPRPTQGAVANAVEHVSASMGLSTTPRTAPSSATPAAAARSMPAVRVHGEGATADLHVDADEQHQTPQAVRVPGGWALTWTDRDHARAVFARTDPAGTPLAAPQVVYEARGDAEDVYSPAAAFNGENFGVAWCDPANGRLVFKRLDAQGHAVGRGTIVHDGLESPLMTRVVSNGGEYGVAVAMHEGVYFARVDARGQRIGDGVVLAEGTRVAALDELRAGVNGYQVAWHDGDERGARHQARVSRGGQVQQAAMVRSHSAGRRFARR